MKLLVIAPYLPYPPDHGGKIRVFELLSRLARRHQITLAALVDSAEELEYVPSLETMGLRVVTARKPPLGHGPGAGLARVFGRRPRIVGEHDVGEFRESIAGAVRAEPPDVIHCEQLHVAQYADLYPASARLLVEQNIEYELLRQIAGARPALASRLAGWADALKTRRVEQRAWRRFSACVTVSDRDRAVVLRHAPEARVYVVPNGVDTEHFRPGPAAAGADALIITGTVGYYPNLDGILWFLREVFPRVRAAVPRATLQIVGRLNAAAEEHIGRPPGVALTGWVDDVRPYVAGSTVFVVPLRIGSGTRLKVLEAMAQGMAIVSTPIGCEGLEVVDGTHLLMADTAERFTEATCRLMGDGGLRRALGANARQLAVDRYDWGRIVSRLERIYSHLADSSRAVQEMAAEHEGLRAPW